MDLNEMISKLEDHHVDCVTINHDELLAWLKELRELKSVISGDSTSNPYDTTNVKARCILHMIECKAAEYNLSTEQVVAIRRAMGALDDIDKSMDLLKLAVEDFQLYSELNDLSLADRYKHPKCLEFKRIFDIIDGSWRYADEANKLIEAWEQKGDTTAAMTERGRISNEAQA